MKELERSFRVQIFREEDDDDDGATMTLVIDDVIANTLDHPRIERNLEEIGSKIIDILNGSEEEYGDQSRRTKLIRGFRLLEDVKKRPENRRG